MIQIKELYKEFPSSSGEVFHALRDINLEIKEGSFVVINGISGSGKSTLLNIIASFMKPTSGNIFVNNKAINRLNDYHVSIYKRDTLGYITQGFHLLEELSVQENLLAPLVIRNISSNSLKKEIDKALKIANIAHKKDESISSLSAGEKQRLLFARAIINDPKVLICDEPTANLDKENSLAFIKTLESFKALGKTILIATHDPLFEELSCVDKTIYIHNGTFL